MVVSYTVSLILWISPLFTKMENDCFRWPDRVAEISFKRLQSSMVSNRVRSRIRDKRVFSLLGNVGSVKGERPSGDDSEKRFCPYSFVLLSQRIKVEKLF